MRVDRVSDRQNFEGNVIVNGKISAQQRYLFNLHKGALEKMMKNLPFDLFVEQSKSKKTIKLSTNVENAISRQVYKNEQNFAEAARLVVEDSKKKSEVYKKMAAAEKIVNMQKSLLLKIFSGEYREAREAEKNLAKFEVENFEAHKLIPNIVLNAPPELHFKMVAKSLKYRIYKAFTRRTDEEKELVKMKKEYLKELESQGKQRQILRVNIPGYIL